MLAHSSEPEQAKDTVKKEAERLRLCLKSQVCGENDLTILFNLKTQEQTEGCDLSTFQQGFFLVYPNYHTFITKR